MPKRPNPFGDPFATQFKMHVSQKEVDMGVNKEKNMKAVYENTLAMLFASQHNMKQTNGHDTNGHDLVNGHMNGHEMNGQVTGHMNGQLNGHMNGHMNGHEMNGQLNGHDMNGHVNGHCQTNCQTNDQGGTQTNVLQQLMSNSQKMTNGHAQGEMDVDMTDEKQDLVSGQSFLDAHCRLLPSISNGASQDKPLATLAAGCRNNNNQSPPSCQMCKTKRPPKSQCSFCDKLLCTECVRQCENCEDRFCNICSAVNYDERHERVFCINCSE